MKLKHKRKDDTHPFERSNRNLTVFSLAFGHYGEERTGGGSAEVKTTGKHLGRRNQWCEPRSSAPAERVLPRALLAELLAHLRR